MFRLAGKAKMGSAGKNWGCIVRRGRGAHRRNPLRLCAVPVGLCWPWPCMPRFTHLYLPGCVRPTPLPPATRARPPSPRDPLPSPIHPNTAPSPALIHTPPNPHPAPVTDLLSETDDGFSLMAYLRAMFAFEWANFKERLRRLVGQEVDIADWGEVTELDFGPGGCA